MPYIGKEPVAGNFVLLDSITTSATATYALTKDSVAYSPESARNMIVSLNGVTQAPETAFTVSGSNITFSSALTSSDVIDYILVLGDVLSVGTPSDGTVGTSQMSYPLGNFSSTGIDDNATSTAITIDSSQRVGIGTASPFGELSISSASPQIYLESPSSGNVQINFNETADQLDVMVNNSSGKIAFGTSSTERMRINSSGDVQIGTAAVTGGRYFDIYNTGSTATDFAITRFITQQVGSASTTSADIIKRKNGEFGIINNDTDSAAHINFKVGASERMRIDSSGNLLVGKTSDDITVAGCQINADGALLGTRANGQPMTLNRTGTDGDVAQFRKSGTTVGSIGVSNSEIYLSSGNTGLYFDDVNNHIRPTNASGAARDATTDLGNSSNRFKDLYLSGGAYFSGTAAANQLDVYEEGTHTTTLTAGSGTPTIASTEDSVGYTVIGDSVFITGQLGTISCSGCSGTLSVTMPFVTKTNTDRSDFYQFIGWTGQSGIAYFVLSQNGGGSSTFFVNALKTDGSYDTNVATLMASAGTFNINIVGGLYKKS